MNDWREVARIDTEASFGFSHAGWAYDAYPDLETLDAGHAMTVADLEGPGVIRFINIPHLVIPDDRLSAREQRALSARGAILEVTFDGAANPSVRVPVADFFADGCNGRASHFSTPFVEKGPITYNCFIPMPFEHAASVQLINETPYDIMCYPFVEYERLPRWDPDLGYFHATWRRWPFQLDQETDEALFELTGPGHLLGQAWSVATDEPFFRRFWFVCEGNLEHRIDGEWEPSVNYLGSECSFGLHWGFKVPFHGFAHGINLLQEEEPSLLSVFRFRPTGGLRFNDRLSVRVNWTNEFRSDLAIETLLRYGYKLDKLQVPPRTPTRNWVDYAVTTYWYQREVGFAHPPLSPIEERTREVLHPNEP